VAMPRPSLRLVHTSDVHLTPRAPESGGASAEEAAFRTVIETVIAEEADALLIAGDLFDSNRVSARTLSFVEAELGRLSCPVVLIPGNHDCYDEESVYRQFDMRSIGPNVHPLTAEDGEVVSFAELQLRVWGKGLVDHVPSNRPLAGVPPRDGDHWFVGMAHGFFVEGRAELRSSLITPEEVATSGFDYLALGHVHVFRDVSQGETRAFYPGSPLIPHAPDRGSIAIVTLDPEMGISVEGRQIMVRSEETE